MSPQPNHQESAAALRSAISEGDVEAVLNLLDRGADISAKNDPGKTPLDYTFAYVGEDARKILSRLRLGMTQKRQSGSEEADE